MGKPQTPKSFIDPLAKPLTFTTISAYKAHLSNFEHFEKWSLVEVPAATIESALFTLPSIVNISVAFNLATKATPEWDDAREVHMLHASCSGRVRHTICTPYVHWRLLSAEVHGAEGKTPCTIYTRSTWPLKP